MNRFYEQGGTLRTLSIPALPHGQWYALARISDFNGTILKRKLFGVPLFLVKNSDSSIKIFKDACPHRGYALSEGRRCGKELVCAYHGWRFGEDGSCSHIPGLNKTPGFKLQEFPCAVDQEIIWVSLEGTQERIPHKQSELGRNIRLSYQINAPAYLLIENTLDPMHTPFVHSGLVRSNTKKKKEVEIHVKSSGQMVEAIFKNEGKQSGLISKIFSRPDMDGIGRYVHPGILELEFKSPKKTYLILTAYLAEPEEGKVSALVDITYAPFPLGIDKLLRPLFRLMIQKVFMQDKEVCEKQYANLKSLPGFRYSSTKLDYMLPYIDALFEGKQRSQDERALKILI